MSDYFGLVRSILALCTCWVILIKILLLKMCPWLQKIKKYLLWNLLTSFEVSEALMTL